MTSYTVEAGGVHVRFAGPEDGPRVLFVHGLLVDGSVWDPVVERLQGRFRCVVPDLPLGSHRTPLFHGADRTPVGMARLLAELMEETEMQGACVVANDTGGAITQLLLAERPELVGELVLTPCDAFDNFLPPLFRPLQTIARSAPAFDALVQSMHAAPVRLATYKTLSKRVTAAQTEAWLQGVWHEPEVRGDLRALLMGIDPGDLLVASLKLNAFKGPARVLWPAGSRIFPSDHGRRLADLLPGGKLVTLPRGRAFVGLDQPQAVADAVLELASTHP